MNSILVGPSWTWSVPVRRLNHAVGFRPFMSIFFRFRTLSNSHHGFSQEKKKVYQIHGNLQNPMAALQILFLMIFWRSENAELLNLAPRAPLKMNYQKRNLEGSHMFLQRPLNFILVFDWSRFKKINDMKWEVLCVCNEQIVSLKMQPLPLGLEKIFIFPTDICKRRSSVKVSSHFESCLLLLGVRRLHSKTIRLKTLTSSILITC